MMDKYGQPPQLAARINLTFHTSAQAFGKTIGQVKPRHADAYHFFNDVDTRYQIFEGTRETYDGPLSMKTDMMMWNITRDKVTERMAVSAEDAWDVPGPNKSPAPDRSRKSAYTPFTLEGRYDTSDVDSSWLEPFTKKHDLTEDDLKAGEQSGHTAGGKYDTSDVHARWLKIFMEENGLTEEDLTVGQ